MCLAIPMQVIAIDGFIAHCSAKGVERDVNLFLLQEESIAVGDFVMVHTGYATQKVSEEEACRSWELFDQILEESSG